jgi:hypothetical protein
VYVLGHVSGQRVGPYGLAQTRICAGSALVPRHVVARRAPERVGDDGVEVWRGGLLDHARLSRGSSSELWQ